MNERYNTAHYDALATATGNVSAYALLKDGQYVGRVVFKYGVRVRCWVQTTGDDYGLGYGVASGYGYDKASSAYAKAIEGRQLGLPHYQYTGQRWDHALHDAGYVVHQIV